MSAPGGPTTMRAAFVTRFDDQDPVSALVLGERPVPEMPGNDWVPVRVKASALNHHDLWSLRGVGLSENALPMILGCDAAGIDPDGNPVIVHAVIGEPVDGDETLDPRRSLLSERFQGVMADQVAVPRRNLVAKPDGLSFAEAACLPTAWLTAYKMLTAKGGVEAGTVVLVQGAGGGVASAAVLLAVAMGAKVYATSRSEAKRDRVAELGAVAVEPGARLPERVDVVIETVGAATLDHSLKCTRPGGRIVCCGSTSGYEATIDLRRIFFLQLELLGSTMGTLDELSAMSQFMGGRGLRPLVDSVLPFDQAARAFERLERGDVFGKIVLDHDAG